MGRHTEQSSSGGYTNSVRLFSPRHTATISDVAVLMRQLTRLGNKKRKAGSVQKARTDYVAARWPLCIHVPCPWNKAMLRRRLHEP